MESFAALPAAELTTDQRRSVEFYPCRHPAGRQRRIACAPLDHDGPRARRVHQISRATTPGERLATSAVERLSSNLLISSRTSGAPRRVRRWSSTNAHASKPSRAFNGSRRTIAGMPGSSSIKHSGAESSGLLVDERPTPRRRASHAGLHTSAHRTEQAPCPPSDVHASYLTVQSVVSRVGRAAWTRSTPSWREPGTTAHWVGPPVRIAPGQRRTISGLGM